MVFYSELWREDPDAEPLCNDSSDYDCDYCKAPCPDEKAKRNIVNCYQSLSNGACPSDCERCEYRGRTREP